MVKYEEKKDNLIKNPSICKENRELYKEFLEWQEYKLKRTNNLRKLDDATKKTLNAYLLKLSNINKWFKNKPLKNLTKQDIKRVYDGLEDGKITNNKGTQFKDRSGYYNKVFKSKLFDMIGKKEIAKEVIEFYKPETKSNVRFIREEDIRKISKSMIQEKHKLFLWLSFDFGENPFTIDQLTKNNFFKQTNNETGQREYRITFEKSIIKRSRTERGEINNYEETAELLDKILPTIKTNDQIFDFKRANTLHFLKRASKINQITAEPTGEEPTWAIIRKSMCADLLIKGWTTDEIKARLGHKPSSNVLDAYLSYLAIGRHKPKKKIEEYKLKQVINELEESKQREKLQNARTNKLTEELKKIKKNQTKLRTIIFEKYRKK